MAAYYLLDISAGARMAFELGTGDRVSLGSPEAGLCEKCR